MFFQKWHPKNSLAEICKAAQLELSSMLKQTGWMKPSKHHHHHPRHVTPKPSTKSLSHSIKFLSLETIQKTYPKVVKIPSRCIPNLKALGSRNFHCAENSAMFGKSFITFQDSMQFGSYLSFRVKRILNPLEKSERS
jgi:hypothetical protein